MRMWNTLTVMHRLIPTISKYAKEIQNAQPIELVLSALLDAILREEDSPTAREEYTALADTLDILHPTPLPADLIVKLTVTAHFYLSTFSDIRKKRMEFFGDDEADDDTLESEREREETEDEILDVMARVLEKITPGHPLLFTIGGLKEINVRD